MTMTYLVEVEDSDMADALLNDVVKATDETIDLETNFLGIDANRANEMCRFVGATYLTLESD